MRAFFIALGVGLWCVAALCGCPTLPQNVTNSCTTAGMVYEPVQIAILGAVTADITPDDVKQKLAAVDRQATGALGECYEAVRSGNGDAVKTAVRGVAAATQTALSIMSEVKRED